MSQKIPTFEYDYARPCVTVDCVVLFEISPTFELLLIQRAKDPFQGKWALPGGFMDIDETLEQAALRELKEETGVSINSTSFIGVYDQIDRDPRDRVISHAFLTIVTHKPLAVADDDAANVDWFDIADLPPLAFDHSKIIADSLQLINQNKNVYLNSEIK